MWLRCVIYRLWIDVRRGCQLGQRLNLLGMDRFPRNLINGFRAWEARRMYEGRMFELRRRTLYRGRENTGIQRSSSADLGLSLCTRIASSYFVYGGNQ